MRSEVHVGNQKKAKYESRQSENYEIEPEYYLLVYPIFLPVYTAHASLASSKKLGGLSADSVLMVGHPEAIARSSHQIRTEKMES